MKKIKSIKVNPKILQAFLVLRAKANAYSRRVEELRTELNLPESNYKSRGQFILTDENSNPIGKFTVSRRKPYQVAAGWTGKIS